MLCVTYWVLGLPVKIPECMSPSKRSGTQTNEEGMKVYVDIPLEVEWLSFT